MRSGATPKQERSTAMRQRLLASAIACLCTEGYAGTTTLEVGARAGVSRGALLYHFPTREQLVAGAVEHLFAELREDFAKRFARLAPGADRLDAAINLLWKVFQDVRLAAVLDLYVAARTDKGLHATLLPVAQAHHDHVLGLARAFFPEAAASQDLRDTTNLLLDTLQGMAIRKLIRPADRSPSRTLAMLKQLAAAVAAT